MAQKIIFDTDPGIDDAMAILFALAAPELEIVGLTTIFGNVHTDLATQNALRLLAFAGRSDIPVAHARRSRCSASSTVRRISCMVSMGWAASICRSRPDSPTRGRRPSLLSTR